MSTDNTDNDPFARMKDSPLKEMLLQFERGALEEGINVTNLVRELGNSLISIAEKTKPQPEYRARKRRRASPPHHHSQ